MKHLKPRTWRVFFVCGLYVIGTEFTTGLTGRKKQLDHCVGTVEACWWLTNWIFGELRGQFGSFYWGGEPLFAGKIAVIHLRELTSVFFVISDSIAFGKIDYHLLWSQKEWKDTELISWEPAQQADCFLTQIDARCVVQQCTMTTRPCFMVEFFQNPSDAEIFMQRASILSKQCTQRNRGLLLSLSLKLWCFTFVLVFWFEVSLLKANCLSGKIQMFLMLCRLKLFHTGKMERTWISTPIKMHCHPPKITALIIVYSIKLLPPFA